MPRWRLFYWNPELLGLGRQIGQINSGAFGIFTTKLSASILVKWLPCPCFPFNHYFYKKLSLYINIHNIYLGLRFEFGPQRIRDLAFDVSVVWMMDLAVLEWTDKIAGITRLIIFKMQLCIAPWPVLAGLWFAK